MKLSFLKRLHKFPQSFLSSLNVSIPATHIKLILSLTILIILDQFISRLYTHRPESFQDLFNLSLIEWYWYIKDVICWTLLSTVPLLLAGKYARYIYLSFISIFIPLSALTVFTWANFKMQLDGDWIGIILSSSTDEFLFFVSSYALKPSFFLGLIIISSALYYFYKTINQLNSTPTTYKKATFAVSFIAIFALMMPIPSAFKSSPAFFLALDSAVNWSYYKKMTKIKHAPKIPDDLKQARNTSKLTMGVFILGESATRNHWSLYGYPKKTTPRMDAIKNELAIFSDVVTPISNTAKAMELIFTHSTLEEPNNPKCTYPQMLKSIGFDVSLYSSQSRWGRWDGVESFIFAGSNPLIFLDEEHLTGPWYDDKLLDYLNKDINTQTNHLVTILHLRGSHFPADAHYPCEHKPKELEKFILETSGSNSDTNTYDASIFFTDIVLGKTIEQLKKRGGPAWMIYLSDHGDSIGANSWRLTNDRNVWEVPMIIWLSNDYKKKFPEIAKAIQSATSLPLQSDLLLAGFLHIAGIKGWEIGSETDFLSKMFKPRYPRLIEGGKLEYPFDTQHKPKLK